MSREIHTCPMCHGEGVHRYNAHATGKTEEELRLEEALDRETFPHLPRRHEPEEVLQPGETRAGYHHKKGRVRLTEAKAWASGRARQLTEKGNS